MNSSWKSVGAQDPEIDNRLSFHGSDFLFLFYLLFCFCLFVFPLSLYSMSVYPAGPTEGIQRSGTHLPLSFTLYQDKSHGFILNKRGRFPLFAFWF